MVRDWAVPVVAEARGFGIGTGGSDVLPDSRVGWGRALGAATVASLPARDGAAVVRDVGWAQARLESTGQHVEQSWVVPVRPATPALDVRVDVEGGVFLGSGDDGLVFRTSDENYLLYGHAVWLDADGRRTRVPARPVDGGIALLVPQALLDRSTYPATLDPILGTAHTLLSNQLTSTRDDQVNPAIADGGGDRLIVWNDDRFDAPGVYGTFRDNFGPIAETQGFLIGRGRVSGTAVRPEVAFGGGHFLVVWASSDGVYATRVDAASGVLDEPAIVVATGGSPSRVKVASQGSDFVLTWQDEGVRPGLRSARLDATGSIATAASYVWEQDAQFHGTSLRAAPGGGYWLVYSDNADGDDNLRLLRLDATGAATDASPQNLVTTFADQSYPDLAFNASGAAMVVYADSSTSAIHGLMVNEAAGGTLTLGAATRISPGGLESGPRVVYDGSHFRVGWISAAPGDPTPQVARITAPTLATPLSFRPAPGSGLKFALGTMVDAVWVAQASTSHGLDIFRSSSTISSTSFSPGVTVSASMVDQNQPRIASNGTRSLVAWVRPTVGGARVYAARVNALGEFLDATPIAVSGEELGARVRGVYSNGTDFRVLWDKGVIGRTGRLFYSPRFTAVDEAGIVSSTGACASEPADITTRGATYIMTYASAYSIDYVSHYTVNDATLSASDCTERIRYTTLDSTILSPLDLATTGTATYLVTDSWRLHRLPPPVRPAISYRATQVAGAPSNMTQVDVLPATDGEVIAYATRLPNAKVGALFVNRDGDVIWQRELATGIARTPHVQLTRANGHYFVLWTGLDGAIFGQRLSVTGATVDPSPVLIAGANDFQVLGDAVTDAEGRCVVVYSAADADTGYAYRVHTVSVDFRYNTGAATGAPCTTGFDCESDFCVDGVCCETACGYSSAGDCQACSVAAGAATDGVCGVVPSGTECRPAAGECDFAEVCDGTSSECPGDIVQPADTACGDAGSGPCDLPDRCDGVSGVCQVSGVAAAGTPCRESEGDCDVADVCDGLGINCPDAIAMEGDVCRPIAGRCDVVEVCDGVAKECPPDLFARGHVCRRSRGVCDVVDVCDGTSPTCPPDELVAAGVECRASEGGCDPAEVCTGHSTTCPADELSVAGTVCRPAAGACDIDETCDGVGVACPADRLRGREALCRPAADACDQPEYCRGTAECPRDSLASDGTRCGSVDACGGYPACVEGSCTEAPECRPPPEGCGCAVPGRRTPGPTSVFGALAGLLWYWRRRRAR